MNDQPGLILRKDAPSLDERLGILLDELEQAIRWENPSILLAHYRSEITRSTVQQQIQARLTVHGQVLTPLQVNKETYDIPLFLKRYPNRAGVVFSVSGLRVGGGDVFRNAYRALNMHREYLVDGHLRTIFWFTPAESRQLPRRAPDFWAFRHLTVDLTDLPQPDPEAGSHEQEVHEMMGRVRKNPEDAGCLGDLARWYYSLGCLEDALVYYRKAFRKSAGNANLAAELAAVYTALGRVSDADRILRKYSPGYRREADSC